MANNNKRYRSRQIQLIRLNKEHRVTLLRYVVAYDVHDPERLREPKTKLEFIYCANEVELVAARVNAENDSRKLPDSIIDTITIDQTGNEWMDDCVFKCANEAVMALELGEAGFAAITNQ